MADYLQKIIYLSEDSYQSLAMNNSIEKNGITLTGIDPNYIYITEDKIKNTDLDENLILPVTHGGTGLSNLASGALLVGNGENSVTTKSIATSITNNSNTIPNTQAVYDYVNSWSGSSNITTIGTLSSGTVPWARLSGVPSYSASNHTHTEYVQNKAGPNDINTIYETGVYNITTGQGTHLPKGYGYGQLLTMGYRSHRGSTKPDWASQIYLHSGVATGIASATAPGNVIYFRTSCNTAGTTADWHEWRKVVHAPINYQKIGSSTKPVYIAEDGTATAITYSIAADVPSDAKFSDTKYSNGTGLSLDGTTFNHSNSVTAQTVQAIYPIKIDAQGHISAYGAAVTPVTKIGTLTGEISSSDLISELGLSTAMHFRGSVAAIPPTTGTYASGDVVLGPNNKEYVYNGSNWVELGSESSFALSSHTHGNIQNNGTLQTSDITIGNGDKLVVTHSSDSSKIARTSVTFDASTSTQCLTKAGTWEEFSNLKIGSTNTTAMAGNTTVTNVSIAAADTTSTGTFPIVFAASNTSTTAAQNEGLKKTPSKLYFQPSTGILTATAFAGANTSKTAAGLCPQLPNETTTTKFLRQDGSWEVPSYPTSFSITANATDGLWDLTGTSGTNAVTYSIGAYSGRDTTNNTARFYTGITPPEGTTRLNYDGYFYATKLYSDGIEVLTSHNNLVKQTEKANTDSSNYKLLASAQVSPTSGTAYEAVYNTKIYMDPSESGISAGQFTIHDNAASPVEKVWMKWNSTDQSLDFIFA